MASFTHRLPATVRLNPLLSDWRASSPYGLPPFADIQAEHFKPAFELAMEAQLAELRAIVNNVEDPTFENTIATFDRSGGVFAKIGAAFSCLCASNAPAAIQAVQLEMAPVFAAHESSIYMLPNLFTRVDNVFERRAALNLDVEQTRLVERIHLDFVRAGARFEESDQKKYSAIVEELATLTTRFQQHLLADESDITVDLREADLEGCPPFLIAAAKQAASEKKKGENVYSITLSRSIVEPFLTFSPRRDLRKRVFEQWTRRGELDPTRDNAAIAKQILLLRVDQAAMHGYKSFAEYQTADTMAKQPQAVMELLERVWVPACASANKERTLLEENMRSELGPDASAGGLEGWDWRYYAERVRKEKYDFDESLLKPYLPLEAMQKAVFDTAEKLFGLRFVPVPVTESAAYHEDVEMFEVRETLANGEDRLVSLFLHDNFARANKRSGAWMSDLRSQSKNSNDYSITQEIIVENDGDSSSSSSCAVSITSTPSRGNVVPIIMNNNNFARGEPTLLSFDDAITLFHECGHGLHGMLSDVRYNRLAGTSVLRDFVELPSQLLEHWLRSTSVVLQSHARHYETGELIPKELLDKITAARNFNQGFATVEYTVCALIDQSLHSLTKAEVESLDLAAFEKKELDRLKMPQGIIMRHRPTHFQHLFADSGYAAAYYVYLWAEVLDADAFDSFLETGDVFHKDTAASLRRHIYSAGNSVEPNQAFLNFKGRAPSIEPMLKKKGLA